MMAAATGFRQKLGSVDIVLDLGEGGLKDPHETVVLQHWRAMGKIFRSEKSPDWLERTWKVLWSRLEGPHSWKRGNFSACRLFFLLNVRQAVGRVWYEYAFLSCTKFLRTFFSLSAYLISLNL